MVNMNIINSIAKISTINIFTYFIIIKLIKYDNNNLKNAILAILYSIGMATLGLVLIKKLEILPSMVIVYFLYSFIISKVTKNTLQYSIVLTFISLTVTYIFYVLSIIISCTIIQLLKINLEVNDIRILFSSIFVESVIINSVFKIKRFKNGITFLKDKDKMGNIGIVGVIIIGVAMVLYSMMRSHNDVTTNTYLFIGIIIELVCLVIWIKGKLIVYYKQKLKENNIADLENQIKIKENEMQKVLEENESISKLNHKYSSRIRALESFTAKIISNPALMEKMQTEFGEDFTNFEKQLNSISKEYSEEMKKHIESDKKIQKTGVFGIDNILEYFYNEANKASIKIELELFCDIKSMLQNKVELKDIETILGDHIKDAIIAINSSNVSKRNILVKIIKNESYEIHICDTGIEFDIDTLIKLGTQRVTTHKLTGGSGIGFMTTFETLKKTKGSLEIEELKNSQYTKVVKIIFDGKNEYRVKSYRANEINIINTNKNLKVMQNKV